MVAPYAVKRDFSFNFATQQSRLLISLVTTATAPSNDPRARRRFGHPLPGGRGSRY